MTSFASFSEMEREVCLVPRCAAIACAASDSSYPSSSKPMVKVCTGVSESDCIRETTVAESMPPDKKAPNGTSATI